MGNGITRHNAENKKIGVVTVLFNSAAHLSDFFHSLNGQSNRNFSLYIVDNASPDDSLERARKHSENVDFPVIFIENEQNQGIAQGNNRGIRAALSEGCDWILLSNNDTVWPSDTLNSILRGAVSCKAEIAVPEIRIHGTDTIWYAGGDWNRLRGGTTHFSAGKPDVIGGEIPHLVAFAPTCCMLIRPDVFSRVGYMDERFFLYYDDSDFVRRAADAGVRVWYLPQVRIFHREGSGEGIAPPVVQYWLSRNLLLFTRKHYSRGYWRYVVFVNFCILFLKRSITFPRTHWLASWKGFRDGFRVCREQRSTEMVETVCPR